MKRILLIVLPLLFITLLSASHLTPMELNSDLQLMYGGEFRTRAIMNNDVDENDGGWFDNRFRFDLAAKLADKLGVTWTTEVGDILWGGADGGFGNSNVNFETRELYLDYQMMWMDMKVRLGQQYWYDHRSLVLDDYFSGITADMSFAGIPTELGFIKYDEGAINTLDDAHVAFANFMFKMPVDWGLTAMFGQCHYDKEADIWIIPYFMLNFEPVMLDLTAVIDYKMFPENADGDESEMGMALAAKADIDMGVKLGLDFLYVAKEGINVLSPYYENGMYIFGNMLPYDGVQAADFVWAPYTATYTGGEDAYMSIVGKFGYPLNDRMDIRAAIGMAQWEDPIGMEFNIGLNYKVLDKLTFNPVLAIGQVGKAWGEDRDGNMMYMLGGLLKAEF